MKLKFRADAEDLLIFVMFAIFLLYIVAIAVVNLNSFATQGHFAGLNPLPAGYMVININRNHKVKITETYDDSLF